MERIKRLLARYRVEAEVIAFPEYSMIDPTGLSAEKLLEVAEPLEGGPWLNFIESLAAEYAAYVVATLFEQAPGKPYNTVVIIAPSGSHVLVYRKTHLFDAYGFRESDQFRAGNSLAKPVDIKGFKTAVAICFEIRFPEIFRTYALQGAELVFTPSGWYRGPLKEETLAFLARARAHENTMYLALPVLYGERFTGRSMIVDPYGVIVAEAGHGERYIEALVEKERLEDAKKDLPLLKLRRPSLYQMG